MNKNLVFFAIATATVLGLLYYVISDENLDDQQFPPMFSPFPVDTAGAKNVTDASNKFALNFYSHVAQNNNENIFFSPWSISTAFSLVYEGAEGDTAEEIRSMFGLVHDDGIRKTSFRAVQNSLNANNAEYSLSVANALWVKEGYDLRQDYVDDATTYYDSEVRNVNFVTDDGVNAINEWVSARTQNKIERILEPGSTDHMTAFVITNAIYFKGEWVHKFTPGFTGIRDFHIDENSTVKVQMMELGTLTKLNHAKNDLLEIIELPYRGDRVSMLVLLPRDVEGLKSVEQSLDSESLSEWKGNLSETLIAVFLPKFTAETEYDLKGTLHDMGMTVPFDPLRADFGGINESDQIFIDKAVHKAFVSVAEDGTEAAAATAITGRSQSGPPATFRADHPFMFLIQDNETGNILFMGRVTDPTR